jgi:hypothetical protein
MVTGFRRLLVVLFMLTLAPRTWAQEADLADGFKGIWYSNQPTKDAHRYKYSGGMATYPQQHIPIAIYDPKANKTFFVFGGAQGNKNNLLHMISYFDHATGKVARPRIIIDKKTTDAHDNPTLAIDAEGYLWVFSSAHGTARPSFIHRSAKPGSIDRFERVLETNFSYTQPWHLGSQGFLFLHTRYKEGRGLFWMTSQDGRDWSAPTKLAKIDMGDYQISWARDGLLATAFDYHPSPQGLNARTNLYYLQTKDAGKSWTTAAGEPVTLPLEAAQNPALVHDYHSEGLLVYLKDLNFDDQGKPVILFLTSKGYAPGPENGPRKWYTTRWTGEAWQTRPFTESDHNYDHGSLYVEPDGTWRVIAPTDPGPQPYGTGGEMVLWTSNNQGETWEKRRPLTHNSQLNHTYARRPVHAHPVFYALWADGNAWEPSPCRLYFTNKEGTGVWQLPVEMSADFVAPEKVW